MYLLVFYSTVYKFPYTFNTITGVPDSGSRDFPTPPNLVVYSPKERKMTSKNYDAVFKVNNILKHGWITQNSLLLKGCNKFNNSRDVRITGGMYAHNFRNLGMKR